MFRLHFSVLISLVQLGVTLSPAQAEVTLPTGLFVNGGANGVTQQVLDHPHIAGILVMSDWATLEPAPGVFDWEILDERIQQADNSDKQARLSLHIGGTGVPDWITDQLDVNGGSMASMLGTKGGEAFRFPAFWDPALIEHKKAFYRELAHRYGDDPRVAVLPVSMADPFTGDWGFHGVDPQSAADAGYDSLLFAQMWCDLVREVMIAAPDKVVATAVGSTPRDLIRLVNPGEDRFFAFETAMSLMRDDPDIDMSRLAGGKASLSAATPDPGDPDLEIPDELNEWRTVYEVINTYGAHGFGQTVWSVSADPTFRMNGGEPYGGAGEPTRADIYLAAAETARNYGLLWLEPFEIDIRNTGDAELQASIEESARIGGEANCLDGCTIERCGDGILDPPESCDDGNLTPGDGCRDDCTVELCGDGILDPQEMCEPADTVDCDAACRLIPAASCGNGIAEPEAGEECDDANAIDGDGCSAGCLLEFCGNGVVERGPEECDDGNAIDGDGCSAACRTESDCTCTGEEPTCDCSTCPTTPRDSCRKTTAGADSRILLKQRSGKFTWRWKGEATSKKEFANPTDDTSYHFCLYDHEGGTAELVWSASLPSGSRWDRSKKGFEYQKRNRMPDGIKKAVLAKGKDGRAKIRVDGRGADLPVLPLAQESHVVAQFMSERDCWEAVYSSPASKHDERRFKDKSD